MDNLEVIKHSDEFGDCEIIKSSQHDTQAKYSFIIAVKNGLSLLKRSLESIQNQEYKNFEVLICNDGSEEEGFDEYLANLVKEDSRFVIVRQENIGLTKSLIRISKIANGEYLLRQDADDVSTRNRLKVINSYVDQGYDLLFSRSTQVFDHGERIVPRNSIIQNISYEILKFGNVFIHGTFCCRREVLLNCNYDSDIYYAQDYDVFIRLLGNRKYKAGIISEPLYKLYMHSDQISTKNNFKQTEFARTSCVKHFGTDKYFIPGKHKFLSTILKIYREVVKYFYKEKLVVLK